MKKLCKQKLCKFVVHHVTSNQRFFTFLKHKNVHFISSNFLSKRLTGKNNNMWSIYFNQKTPGVLLFRIYHIEMHVTQYLPTINHLLWLTIINHNKFLTGVQDQNLLFTFLTNDYEAKFRQIAFSGLVRIINIYLPSFFQYLLLLYEWDLNMSRLTCNAILCLVMQISPCRSDFRSA